MSMSRKWRKNRVWIGSIALVAIAAAVFLVMRSAGAKEEQATTAYTTGAAAKGTLSVTVSGSGNLELADTVEVWPEIAGTVDSLEVAEGAKVKAGEVLFTIDGDDAASAATKALASYRQAQSAVLQQAAQVTKAEASLDQLADRAESASSTVTDADTELAQAELASARAQLSAAKATLASALDEYNNAAKAQEDLEVTAPVSGIVYACDIEDGDSVSTSGGSTGGANATTSGAATTSSNSGSASSAPLVIVPIKPLQATLTVNEVDLPSLKVGQRADLEFDALPDVAMTGKVTEVADEGTVDQGVVSFEVVVTLDVINPQLKPGMSVAATIVTAVERDALLVPNAAVKTDDSGDYVQVLDATGQPQRVDVQVGLANDTKTQIVSGLDEGADVVTATTDSSDDSGTSDRQGAGMGVMMGGGPGR